jgi:hypothetical protein
MGVGFVGVRQAGQFLPQIYDETVFVFPIVEEFKGVQ